MSLMHAKEAKTIVEEHLAKGAHESEAWLVEKLADINACVKLAANLGRVSTQYDVVLEGDKYAVVKTNMIDEHLKKCGYSVTISSKKKKRGELSEECTVFNISWDVESATNTDVR
jgi:hypothetical protein